MFLSRFLMMLICLISSQTLASVLVNSDPIGTDIELKQVSPTEWLVTYNFPQKISSLDFGRNLLGYRENAWHSISPNSHYQRLNQGDSYLVENALSLWTFQVNLFQFYPNNSYLPISTFSDGGVVFDLGQLVAQVKTALGWQSMRPHFILGALQDQQALFLTDDSDEIPSYVYFGTKPVLQKGHLKLLIDSKLPSWLLGIFSDVIFEKLIDFYQKKLSPLPAKSTTLIVAWAVPPKHHFESKILGGEINNQLIFTLYGQGFEVESVFTRQTLLKTLAHEVAHLWQPQASVDVEQPEFHEGGAEWLAVNTLLATDLWTRSQYTEFNKNMQYQCHKQTSDKQQGVASPDYFNAYACAYDYFRSLPVDGFKLWEALLSASKRSQSPIDQFLIEKTLKQVGTM